MNILLEDNEVSNSVVYFLRKQGYIVFNTPPKDTGLDYAISTNGIGTLFKWNPRKSLFKKLPIADKLILWQTKGLIKNTSKLDKLDEVWYIAHPTQLEGILPLHPKVLPLLLKDLPSVSIGNEEQRIRKVIVIGEERSQHIQMTKDACQSISVDFEIFDPIKRARSWGLGEEQVARELQELLSVAAVSVALYSPNEDKSFYYSDPKRIKQSLAFGVPVITTPIPPIWKEIEQFSAGVVIKDFYLDALKLALEIVLSNWQVMAINARTLAEKYVVSSDWINLMEEVKRVESD